jgi:hypothetical protein
MTKLVSFCGKREMWVKLESVTAIEKSPQSGRFEDLIFWNVKGQGWSILVRELPINLRRVVN